MDGEESFHYRPDTMRRTTTARKKSRQATADLSDADTALLGTLKALRLSLAKERGVPAYVIFSDKTLADMAQRRPGNDAEFADVNGVGAAKLKDFAELFLGAIAETP